MAGDRDAPYQKGRTKILDPQVFDGLEHLRPWIIWVPPRVSPIVPMVNRCKWHPTILAILQYRLILPKASATRAGQSQAPFFTAEVLFRWMICPSKNKQRTADRKCDLSRAQSHLLTAQAPSGGKPVFFPLRSQAKTKQASKKANSSFSTHQDEEGWGLSSYAGAPPFELLVWLVDWTLYPCLVSFADTWTLGPR